MVKKSSGRTKRKFRRTKRIFRRTNRNLRRTKRNIRRTKRVMRGGMPQEDSKIDSSSISKLQSESSYGLDGPEPEPEPEPMEKGDEPIPMEVQQTISKIVRNADPYLPSKIESNEANKKKATEKLIDFIQRGYSPEGRMENQKNKALLEINSDSSDYGSEEELARRKAQIYFDRQNNEEEQLQREIDRLQEEERVMKLLKDEEELVDFELCDNIFNHCYLSKDTLEECKRLGYEGKFLIPCKDRTQVYLTTFFNRPNGLDEIKDMLSSDVEVVGGLEVDSQPVEEMGDDFPTRIFTTESVKEFYSTLISMRLCSNFVKDGETMGPELDNPYRRATGFRGAYSRYTGDRVSDLYNYFKERPDKLQEFFRLFEDNIIQKGIHADKGDKQSEYIERMKRYILLRLMNRDPFAPKRINYQMRKYIERLKIQIEDINSEIEYAKIVIQQIIIELKRLTESRGRGLNYAELVNSPQIKRLREYENNISENTIKIEKIKQLVKNVDTLLQQNWHPKIYLSNVGPQELVNARNKFYED